MITLTPVDHALIRTLICIGLHMPLSCSFCLCPSPHLNYSLSLSTPCFALSVSCSRTRSLFALCLVHAASCFVLRPKRPRRLVLISTPIVFLSLHRPLPGSVLVLYILAFGSPGGCGQLHAPAMVQTPMYYILRRAPRLIFLSNYHIACVTIHER